WGHCCAPHLRSGDGSRQSTHGLRAGRRLQPPGDSNRRDEAAAVRLNRVALYGLVKPTKLPHVKASRHADGGVQSLPVLLGNSSTVEHRTLTPRIKIRILV